MQTEFPGILTYDCDTGYRRMLCDIVRRPRVLLPGERDKLHRLMYTLRRFTVAEAKFIDEIFARKLKNSLDKQKSGVRFQADAKFLEVEVTE
jgi:hypothetical protein